MKFWNHAKDVERERKRYDLASALILSRDLEGERERGGYSHFPREHIPPFKRYYDLIENELPNVKDVLEIGAGTGQHTRPVVTPSLQVTAVDISKKSLEILQVRFKGSVSTVVANIEKLPFADSSFDLIISCGVLSYGDPSRVDQEIIRTLRPGGTFIFLDSLNHNPIFKLNRWFRFLRGSRSLSTVLRIPKMKRVEKLASYFKESHYWFFGQWIWVHQILRCFLGPKLALRTYDILVNQTKENRYAFKVVSILKGKKV